MSINNVTCIILSFCFESMTIVFSKGINLFTVLLNDLFHYFNAMGSVMSNKLSPQRDETSKIETLHDSHDLNAH